MAPCDRVSPALLAPLPPSAPQVQPSAKGARNFSQCDSMLIGDSAGANTYPYIQVGGVGAGVRGSSACKGGLQ